jgi:hypothetical protein
MCELWAHRTFLFLLLLLLLCVYNVEQAIITNRF